MNSQDQNDQRKQELSERISHLFAMAKNASSLPARARAVHEAAELMREMNTIIGQELGLSSKEEIIRRLAKEKKTHSG